MLSSVRRAPDAEVDVVAWLPLRSAISRLTYESDHHLVRQCLEQPATTPLILVRHAKAMDRKDWSKRRRTPAVRWPAAAASRPGSWCRCSPRTGSSGWSVRARRAASPRSQPYASKAGLKVDKHDELSEEQGVERPKAVIDLVRKVREATVATQTPTVICVHRPVLGTMLEALDLAPTTLATGEMLVAHLTAECGVHAIERHRVHG